MSETGTAEAPRQPRLRGPWFHLVGAVLVGAGACGAVVALFIVDFATSSCTESLTKDVWTLRIGIIGVTAALATVPAGWAALGRHRMQVWQPWAALAAVILIWGVVGALTRHEVTRFCLF